MLTPMEIRLLEAVFSEYEIEEMSNELIFGPESDRGQMLCEIIEEFHKRFAAIKTRGGIQIEGLV